ncbi:transmembrane amino acid transporter protein-domain-containing protein [Ilyonectria robusta]|uniref:transmembrane amino acid transporter protein-domain-containing protein n=1 Tax=Ilyonectria robusta TaxID=1079257 RepID=UPI001E8D5BC2|nr:transmembrane amino acid transporter protein-domain-containing protein [Ilyonectria robusta]KAH8686424.1 transmembrane amino acid transporter protein-domain-containing protein [Ilyonectria robusta]
MATDNIAVPAGETTNVNSRSVAAEKHQPTQDSLRHQDDQIVTAEDDIELNDTKPGETEPVENIFSQGGKNYRTLSRWDTVFVLVTNQVGLGILSLPSCLKVLGVVPGIIAIIGLGSLSAYTAYQLLQFYRRYPHVVNVVDMCGIIGGRPLEIIAGIGLMVKVMMTCASASVTLSVSFNTLSNHAFCTVAFITIAIIACWVLCLPRTVKFVSQSGIPSTISILAAAMIVMISLGVGKPTQAPPGWDKEIQVIGNPTFREGVNACLKICYAYAGNISFVSYMAEMRNPTKDFPMALACLEVFSISIYTVVAIAIYCLAGQYTTSPALGSAPHIAAKVAYGIVLPAVFATAMAFGHTGIKYMYVVAMRWMKATHQVTDRSAKSWSTWIACVTLYWIIVWVISNAIPVFDSILAISSATTIAWFTFGLSAVFWFHLNKGSLFNDWKMILLTILNSLLIIQSLFMNAGGLWSSITELISIFESDSSKVKGAFSCGDNSSF